MAKKIRVWDGTQWQDVAPALPYTAVHSAQASMPSTGVDGQIWLDTDGTLSDTAFVPLSTIDAKGDLLVGTADNTVNKLTAGSNDTVLTADSSTATGLKWATVAAGANWSLLNAGGTALTGAATITISGISGKDKLMVLIQSASNATTGNSVFGIRFNADSSSNYTRYGSLKVWNGTWDGNWNNPEQTTAASVPIANNGNIDQSTTGYLLLTGGNSSGVKQFQYFGLPNWVGYNQGTSYQGVGFYNSSSVISSVSIISTAGNFDGGTIYVYASA
jgi:hypothetical protein